MRGENRRVRSVLVVGRAQNMLEKTSFCRIITMKGDGENMDIIGVIADICTIVGLFVAIFVASQVTKNY